MQTPTASTSRPTLHPRSVNGSAMRRGQRQTSTSRVYDILRTGIRQGTIAPNATIGENELVALLDTSRQAVREALQALAVEGLVIRRRRVGTTVAAAIRVIDADQLMWIATSPDLAGESEVVTMDTREVTCPPWLQLRLQCAPGEAVQMTEELITVDQEPVCIRVAYRPTARLPERQISRVQDLASAFRTAYGVGMAGIESLVQAVAADGFTAKNLGIAEGSPLLLRETALKGEDGLIRELSYMHYRGDRFCIASNH